MGAARAVALAVLLVGCAHAPARRPGSFHTVASGETLFGIARAHGVSVDELARENAIDDPARIEPGMALFIPRAVRLDWPVRGVLFSRYGRRGGDQHDGIDLAAPEGTEVRAASDGTVIFSGEKRGYGKLILLGHGGDLVTVYAHNRENFVSTGDRVSRGELIARVGRTGNATGPHLHFEVRVAERPRDPLRYLP